LQVSGTGVSDLQRSHSTTTAPLAVLDIKAKSTGDMAAGFGSAARFIIEDTANVENVVAEIAARRESSDSTASLTFTTSATERMRIDSAGHAIIGGGVTLGNGQTYAAANTLDDYEEGNWTMAVVGASGSAGAWAMSGRVARYTKIGRVVHFSATGYLTNLGSYTGSSAIQITGLPFVSNSSINVACSASSIPIGQYNSTNYVPQVMASASYIQVRKGQYGDSIAIYNEQSINIRYNISGTYNVA
jgi:hypothetical protein